MISHRTMMAVPSLLLAALWVATAPAVARGEIKTVAERNSGGDASAAFKFKGVPAPSKTDAATGAKFTLVDGRRDRNGGPVDNLTDGKLPADEDGPAENFFFAQRQDGGRLLLDLGQVTEVRQVNTYSWHAGTRGPQVYKLYAADGSAKDFDSKPLRATDPEKAGWTLLATVDTRPAGAKDGADMAGQYGVSVADSAGGVIGKYRYVLIDARQTEDGDAFGNTFFSEIDISDGKEHAAPAAVASADGPTSRPATAAGGGTRRPPATGPAVVAGPGTFSVKTGGDQYEIFFDLSETPELMEWAQTKLKPACAEWYPKIVELLPSDGYSPPKRFNVLFKRDGRGVAYTSGTQVVCAYDWFSKNLKGEATGAVIHELVHVVQQYGRARGGKPNPGWLVEGTADYIRWFMFEPESARPRPNPARAKYTDSYRTTAAFLFYVANHHDKEFVKKMSAAMRQGKYSEDLWKEYTGKTVDELWAEYVKTLEKARG